MSKKSKFTGDKLLKTVEPDAVEDSASNGASASRKQSSISQKSAKNKNAAEGDSGPTRGMNPSSDSSDSELDFELPSRSAPAVQSKGSRASGARAQATQIPVAKTLRGINYDESDSDSSDAGAGGAASGSENDTESDDVNTGNIVGTIAKGLSDIKHSRNAKKLSFGSSSEEEDDEPITKLTVNKEFQKQFEKTKQMHSLSKEHQRAMESLQEQLREQAKREKRAAKRARQLAAVKAGEEYVDSDSEEDSESDYSTEDEDGKLLSTKRDIEIMETLKKLRKRDPSVYDKSAKFYESSSSTEDEDEADSSGDEKVHKERRMTLGRLLAERFKEGKLISDSEDDEENRPLTHEEEQQALRKALIESARMDDDDDDDAGDSFFGTAKQIYNPEEDTTLDATSDKGKLTSGPNGNLEDGAENDKSRRARGLEKLKKRSQALSEEERKKIMEEKANRFLEAYVMGGLWKSDADRKLLPSASTVLGKERGKLLKAQLKAQRRARRRKSNIIDGTEETDEEDGESGDEVHDDDDTQGTSSGPEYFSFDEDDEFLDKSDEFEANYNFRFEEPGADQIVSYPRPHMIEGSVRKKSSRSEARRAQRQRKKQRLQEEKQRKLEELRRLKNIQRKAVADRLAVIAKVAGLRVNTKTGSVEDDESAMKDATEAEEDMEYPNFDDEDDEAAIAKLKEKMFGRASGGIAGLTMKDLTTPFDPEEHDRRMNEIFNEEFYNELDESELDEEERRLKQDTQEIMEEYSRELNKPDSTESSEEEESEDEEDSEADEKEREELKLLKESRKKTSEIVKQKERAANAFIVKTLTQVTKAEDAEEEAEFWLKQETERLLRVHGHKLPPDYRKWHRRELLRKLMELELQEADAEAEQKVSTSGNRVNLKFEYEHVPASTFGMTIEEILSLPDRELNMRVGMKRLAPYREDAEELARKSWQDLKWRPKLGVKRGKSRDGDDEEEEGHRPRWEDRGRNAGKHGYRPDPYAFQKKKGSLAPTKQHTTTKSEAKAEQPIRKKVKFD